MTRKAQNEGPEGGVNQNWQHELNICNKILNRERNQLASDRTQVELFERMIRLDMERINALKIRICQLETHGNG